MARERRAPRLPLRELLLAASAQSAVLTVSPLCVQPVPWVNVTGESSDPDDPAIWVHARHPSESLILGTDKGTEAAGRFDGALNAYRPNGELVRSIAPLHRPNNVDVEYGLQLPDGRVTDIAVTCERGRAALRIYELPSLRALDGGGLPVFEGQADRRCMGVGLYRRPTDGAMFVILSRKSGPSGAYLWQYRLQAAPTSTNLSAPSVALSLVRQFGEWSGQGEIEAVAVDDAAGNVFYSDELCCVRSYSADPAGGDTGFVFAQTEFVEDREGISIYMNSSLPWDVQPPQYQGFIFVSDQQANGTFQVFCRTPPHGYVGSFTLEGVLGSDGSDVTGSSLGPGLSKGGMVAMSDEGHRFATYDMEKILSCLPADACKAPPHQESTISQISSIVIICLMLLCSLGYVAYILITRGCASSHSYQDQALQGEDLEEDDEITES